MSKELGGKKIAAHPDTPTQDAKESNSKFYLKIFLSFCLRHVDFSPTLFIL